jgi:signal transduction histidine kinase
VRHAQARSCTVRLTAATAPGEVCLEVDDDGCGIPDDRPAGVGLSSMRERAVELGGTWAVERRPGGGTHVVAVLPCRVAAGQDGRSTWTPSVC